VEIQSDILDHDSVNGFTKSISDICIYLFMPFNLIVLATPPFKTFSFMHDKSNEYY